MLPRYPLMSDRPVLHQTFLTLMCLLVVCGCSSDTSQSESTEAASHDDHNHASEHDHPTTLKAGLVELSALRDTVRDAFAADDVDTAHGPLHDVGHLLEDITSLVEKQQLSDEDKVSAKEQIEALFDSFGAVDRTLHGQDGSTYKDVSDKIDAAIAELQRISDSGTDAEKSSEAVENESGEN